ncbi:PilZ domain-containing protein [Bacillus sp. FJAT-22090]|uniref:PilZ domain-containing protein n=1 Tax=Bacillus sp. FJAT-22090 TaxID=1581038 RepID=UPI00119C9847|nr:PilZ domain-containing protein [Bacillus sp. FJAT-22090]
MQYKRNEYFRYSFTEPFEATFRLIKDANGTSPEEISKKGICQIIDISPNGLKIFTDLLIAIDKLNHVEIQFRLDEALLSRIGEFVWSHRKAGGYEYGVKLLGDTESEQEIITELKSRRKKEIIEKK